VRLPSRTFGLLQQRENDSFQVRFLRQLAVRFRRRAGTATLRQRSPRTTLVTPSLAAVFSSRVPVRKNFAPLVRRLQTQSICQRKINPCFTSKMGKTLELGGYRAVRFEMSVRNALAV